MVVVEVSPADIPINELTLVENLERVTSVNEHRMYILDTLHIVHGLDVVRVVPQRALLALRS